MIESLNALDRFLFITLNSLHANWLNSIMLVLSGQFVWVPLIGFFLWKAFKKLERKEAYLFLLFLILAIVASDITSSYILKNIFSRLRPCRIDELKPFIYSFGQKCGGKFGFVSSHAANALAITIFSLRSLKFKKAIWPAFLMIPLAVSYSRIYLGVHFPGDILGGLLVGLFWGYFFSWVFTHLQGANR